MTVLWKLWAHCEPEKRPEMQETVEELKDLLLNRPINVKVIRINVYPTWITKMFFKDGWGHTILKPSGKSVCYNVIFSQNMDDSEMNIITSTKEQYVSCQGA